MILTTIVLTGLTTFATSSESLKCPVPQPEYSALLKQLDDLKLSLEQKEECRGLATELEDLSIFQSHSTLKYQSSIEEGIQKQVIDPDSLREIGEYTRASAGKILRIVRDLQQNPSCVSDKKKPSFLSSLANIAQQTTSLVGSYAGPYGIALSVGGAVFSNILLAFDDFLKSDQYDFSDPSKRHLYMTSVCLYHDIRQEIMDIINPEERLATMEELVVMLNEKERVIRNYCQDCDSFFKAWDLSRRSQPKISSIKIALRDSMQSSDQIWNDCENIANLVHTPDSALATLMEDIRTNFPIEQALWTYDYAVREGVPDSHKCWTLEATALKPLNDRSRSMLRSIVTKVETHLQSSITKMVQDYGTVNEDNLPNKLSKTFSIRDWAEHERNLLRRLQSPGSSEARAEINQRRLFLTRRLLRELTPQFLNYQIRMAGEGQKNLSERFKATGEMLNGLVGPMKWKSVSLEPNSLAVMLESISYGRAETSEIEKVKLSLHHQEIYALVYDYLSYVDQTDFGLSTVVEYCKYFELAGTEFPEISLICNGEALRSSRVAAQKLEPLKIAILLYVDWCHAQGYIQADSIRNLRRNIDEFNRTLPLKYPAAKKAEATGEVASGILRKSE